MAKTVLLLGVEPETLAAAERELAALPIDFVAGSCVADVGPAFRDAVIDHVIIGCGVEREARAAMVREILLASDRTTVHMNGERSEPEGFLPFAVSVLVGLAAYEPGQSPADSRRWE